MGKIIIFRVVMKRASSASFIFEQMCETRSIKLMKICTLKPTKVFFLSKLSSHRWAFYNFSVFENGKKISSKYDNSELR